LSPSGGAEALIVDPDPFFKQHLRTPLLPAPHALEKVSQRFPLALAGRCVHVGILFGNPDQGFNLLHHPLFRNAGIPQT